MIRLLIADDSALMRKLLEGIFLAEGDFDIRWLVTATKPSNWFVLSTPKS